MEVREIVFCVIIGIMGILSVVLAVQMALGIVLVIKLRSSGILCEAEVIYTTTSYYRFPYRTPFIEYKADGRIIRKKMREQGLLTPWKTGDKLRIRYDPVNHEKCYIINNSVLYYITGLLISLLFGIVCSGLVISTVLGL